MNKLASSCVLLATFVSLIQGFIYSVSLTVLVYTAVLSSFIYIFSIFLSVFMFCLFSVRLVASYMLLLSSAPLSLSVCNIFSLCVRSDLVLKSNDKHSDCLKLNIEVITFWV